MDTNQPTASTSTGSAYVASDAPDAAGSAFVTSDAPVVREVRPSKQGRSHGKAWKSEKTATRRAYLAPVLKTPFEKRMEKEKARKAIKAVETEMKEEADEERERKRTHIRERRERQAEKKRLEEMATKMSAKKLQRMKKGRSKKING